MITIQITACDVIDAEVVLSRIRRGMWIQLRDPQLSGRALLAFGNALRERTASAGAKLLVNDRLDIALAIRADGMHLGRTSLDPATVRQAFGDDAAIITRSAHAPAEVAAVMEEGADAALLSPIFASPKKGGEKSVPLGLDALREARALVGDAFPIVALGGVTADRAAACIDAGASGVAAIRAAL